MSPFDVGRKMAGYYLPITILILLSLSEYTFGQRESRTGNVCYSDTQCPDNAFCKGGSYCVCKDGFIINQYNATSVRECLKEAKALGDPCSETIQCQSRMGSHAECNNGICDCKVNSHFEEGRCYLTALIGERCSVNQNCHLGDESIPEYLSFCVRGYCTCQLNYSPRDHGVRCVRDANLGEKCEDELQCAGVGQECTDGLCRCRANWTTHPVENRCLQIRSTLEDVCEADVQCVGLSGGDTQGAAAICSAGKCVCIWGAAQRGDPTQCWIVKTPGQDCRFDEECFSEEEAPGYCRGGRCTCDTCSPDSRDFSSSNAAYNKHITIYTCMVTTLAITASKLS